MENNNPKKSKAFIITFILILILLVAGYYLFKNRDQIFGTKGSTSENKKFWPLFGSSKDKDLIVIEDPKTSPNPVVNTTPKRTGTIITDANGNKLILAEAGEILKKGDVLYVAGFNANNQPIVMKAIANDKNKSLVFGVAGEDMEKGTLGHIIIEGILSGVPTNRKEGTLWKADNPLYLSDKIFGGMTKNPPVSPSFVVPVGSVIKVDPINGSIRIGNIKDDKNINNKQKKDLNNLFYQLINIPTNTSLVNSSMGEIRDYFSSIFNNGLFNGIDYNGDGLINSLDYPDFDFNGDGVVDEFDYGIIDFNGDGVVDEQDYPGIKTPEPGVPPVNPIVPPVPGSGTDPDTITGTDTDICKNGATNFPDCTTKDGACLDKTKSNPPLCNIKIAEPNKCLDVEQNPLIFTPEEKARLAVLLRKFYLVSSTLKTPDDITTIYNEIDQQKNFIEQIQGLTAQCYSQINTGMINENGWIRHGNPWYTETSGGSFPYTNENRGYLKDLDKEQIDIERILNIW